jgi:outer membrane protein assembly factor BamB
MLSSIVPWIARAMVAACALLIAGPTFARGLHRMSFRVDLRTGDVESLPRAVEPPAVAPWPSLPADQRRWVTSNRRTLVVLEGNPGDRGPSKATWQFTVPGSSEGWMAWHVVLGRTVVYAWREQVPGQLYKYRETIRAMDMDGLNVLWERVELAHDPPGAAAVGDFLVVDRGNEVVLLETRTGRLIRSIAKSAPPFAITSPGPGRVWVEAGDAIECIDDSTTKPSWRISKQGRLLWLVPVPGSDDWLVKTTGHVYRVRAADGRVVWSAGSTSASRPLLNGNHMYEATVVRDRSHDHAQLSVIARDLQTGKVLREYPLPSYDAFFDQGRVTAVEVHDGRVDVAAEFIILD